MKPSIRDRTAAARYRSLALALSVAVTLARPTMALAAEDDAVDSGASSATVSELAAQLAVGDIVFIRVTAGPFREVARATQSWTDHVGIVIATDGAQALIGESTFPLSRATPFAHFVARSEGARVAVLRLNPALTPAQQARIVEAARARFGILYDTGFDMHSQREFCSRYVREVVQQATGTALGNVETFRALLLRHPDTSLTFWKFWFVGSIPWDRETVTPASLLRDPQLTPVFDGSVRGSEAPPRFTEIR